MTVLYRRGGYSTQLHRPNLLRHKGDDGVVIGIDEIIDSSLVLCLANN
jgi:NH3-dependent NAD+ synthetase